MRVTIAVASTRETVERSRSLAAALAAGGDDVEVVGPVAALDVEVTPPYLTESYGLYRALREREFRAVVFPDRGGSAYCTARARQLGLGFASTAVVIDCREPTLFTALRERRPFLSKRIVGTATAERLSLELADAFLCEDPDLLEWFGHEGWTLPQGWTGAGAGPRARAVTEEPPLVSVAVAYRNRTTYLPVLVEGLVRQTYPALEVVIADDGSTVPAAKAQLAELESRRWPWPLRVVRLPHGGLGAARNGGWRAASGDLVLFMDDDDVPFDDLVETLWRARAASGVDVAVAGARFFRGEGAPTAHEGDVVRISLCEPRELGVISNQYGGPVNLWPRALLERLGGFADVATEDWDMLARATLAGARLATPPDPLYWYRQTPGGMYSVDPIAHRDAGLAVTSSRFAEQLPDGMRLLPQLAAGAYSELERRRRAARPRWRTVVDLTRLLDRRRREVQADEGLAGVVRGALRLGRRRL